MKRKSGFKNLVVEYNIEPESYRHDADLFLHHSLHKVVSKIKKWLKKHGGVKFQLSLNTLLAKYKIDTNQHFEIRPWFLSPITIVLNKKSMKEDVRKAIRTILAFFDGFIQLGSGWFLKEVLALRLSIYRYNPLGGRETCKLKTFLSNKRSLLNIANVGNQCFLYCILAGLHDKRHNATRASLYTPFLSDLNISSLTFPVKLSQISKFEKHNKITVNVFGIFKNGEGLFQPYPMYISTNFEEGNHVKHINLLLYEDHYLLIRDMNKFIRPFFYKKTRYYCHKCLTSYCKREALSRHMSNNCGKNFFTGQSYIMPLKGSKLEYKDYSKQVKNPFIIYADFETCNKKLKSGTMKGKTELKTCQKLNAFGAILLSKYDKFSQPPFLYVGKNVLKRFVSYLLQKRAEISHILDKDRKPISLTTEDINRIRIQESCYLCNTPFSKRGIKKVLDHAHLGREGKGRDVNYACNRCNLSHSSLRMDTLKITIVMHNAMNFDFHFVVERLYRYIGGDSIKVLPRSSEKFLTLQFENFQIIDSFQFLPTSLCRLAELLGKNNPDNFIETKKHLLHKDLLPYVIKKGVMCYDYIDSWKKLKEKRLPSKNEFYNTLTKENISEEAYEHALSMFKLFKCRNIKDYLKEYLKIDILLLCDVFESFREKSMDFYGLDPAKYLTAPALSYQAMLKFTNVKLDLLDDLDMYNFIESGIRGGMTNVVQRYAEVKKRSEHLIYLDCNNLYGESMSQSLPCGSFEWSDPSSFSTFDVEHISDDADVGYILEVTLEYPSHIHLLHDDLPLAPEKSEIYKNDLSPYALSILEKLDVTYKKSGAKLISSLREKKNYIVHYRNLKLYLQLGMKLVKIHRIMSFKQARWMKKYIDFNNQKRKEATSSFDKEFFKLMNNSAFGKCMENVKKRTNMTLTSSREKCRKLIRKPTFHSLHIFNKDYVGIQQVKDRICLDKPIYLGFTILELSKMHMFSFHYNIMLPTFVGSKIKLLYTDTDSFIYFIDDKSMIEKLRLIKDYFDFSNLENEHPLHCTENMKVLGKFKNETGGKKIKEFVALRPKMYSILFETGEETKRVKGIKKSSIRDMRHEQFKTILFEKTQQHEQYHAIRSYKHKVYVVQERKLALSPFEDKRWLKENGIESLAYGNFKLEGRKRKFETTYEKNLCKKIREKR